LTITSFFKYQFPGIVWGILIFILLSLPEDNLPELSFWQIIPYFDKLVHLGLFTVFSFLLCLAFRHQLKYYLLRKYWVISSFILSVLYGGITEILQKLFFHRNAEQADLISDICGSILGIIIYNYFINFEKKIK